ncbi:MAG: hypothetical protein ABW175_05420 [Bradyrhizobium sp.]
MVYAALGLTILGLSAGLMSRLKVLLLLVGIVLLLSIMISVRGGFSFLGSVAVIVIAQTILQSSYLVGVAIHTMLTPSQAARSESESMDPAGGPPLNAFGRLRATLRLTRPLAQGGVRGQFSSRQR